MSTTDRASIAIRPQAPQATNHRVPHAELEDLPLIEDAARRLGQSGQALFEYFSRLDALRDVADEIGQAALADRAARAEMHTRVLLSAGLDALNEMHGLGLVGEG